MVWDKGFNIRATSAYVTDGTDETYSIGTAYPETRNGCTFGWDGNRTGNTRNRNAALDRRLAGIVFGDNACIFRVDLPAAGDYDLRIAMGDGTNAQQDADIDIRDNTTTVLSIGPDKDTGIAEFIDASNTLRTAAAWPGSNVAAQLTFATTTLFVHLLDAATNTTIAHLFLSQVGGAVSLPFPPGPRLVMQAVNRASSY